jgi:hypothetical protein
MMGGKTRQVANILLFSPESRRAVFGPTPATFGVMRLLATYVKCRSHRRRLGYFRILPRLDLAGDREQFRSAAADVLVNQDGLRR